MVCTETKFVLVPLKLSETAKPAKPCHWYRFRILHGLNLN